MRPVTSITRLTLGSEFRAVLVLQREMLLSGISIVLIHMDTSWCHGELCHWCANEMASEFGPSHHDARICGLWEETAFSRGLETSPCNGR